MPLIIFFLLLISLPISISQTSPAPSPVSPPASDSCNGIFISYIHTAGTRLPPLVTDPSRQPYSFKSTVQILNNGLEDLKLWKIFVGFQHDEYLVSATNAVLADGSSIPTNVGNGTVFAGFPTTDLKSAVETAGDYNQMGVQIELVGTQYGVADPDIPMPSNLSLAMDGFICPKPTLQGENVMNLCCLKDQDFIQNVTDEKFLPRQNGDLTIDYDVIRAYESDYYARVKLSNHHPLGRLDNWKLSWDWMRDEFIYTMKGAHPSVADSSSCIYGRQGAYYKELDFANVLTCDRRPTILDLPPSKVNDPVVGLVPFCCRNGTILPTSMDPSKSISAFEVHVMKMPPDLNRTQLIPPQNWKISGRLNPDYECGPPVRVSPSQFPDQSGLPFNRTSIASWQVVCNITQAKKSSPQCCVSFSAFYNDSVIPCNTCACGCPKPQKRCSTTAPALLLPPEGLLVPFANRTKKAIAWSHIKHRTLPRPLPCGDNCGVSINWHVYTDYRGGWSARVTLFNWGETDYADWFAAMQFKKAAPGFEKMYSFNGSRMLHPNDTIFMQGLEGLNYLVAEQDAANPSKNPPVPGKLQSVLSFTKKRTPGIDVASGDGFPSKVFFNGEECSLPPVIPSNGVRRPFADLSISMVPIILVVFLLIQQ